MSMYRGHFHIGRQPEPANAASILLLTDNPIEAGMFERILPWRFRNGRTDEIGASHHLEGTIAASQLRAVSTEAGLVTSVDGSPAVLVNLWAHGERLHPYPGHRPIHRRTN